MHEVIHRGEKRASDHRFLIDLSLTYLVHMYNVDILYLNVSDKSIGNQQLINAIFSCDLLVTVGFFFLNQCL